MSDSGPTDSDVKGFRENYPALSFELKSQKDLQAQYVEVGIPEAQDVKKKTCLVFSKTQVLAEVLAATAGLTNLRFLDPDAAVALGDSVCILVAGLKDYSYEWFLCDFSEEQFDTFIGSTRNEAFYDWLERFQVMPQMMKSFLTISSGQSYRSDLYRYLIQGSFLAGFRSNVAAELVPSPESTLALSDREVRAQQLASTSATLLASRVGTRNDLARALVSNLLPPANTGYVVITGSAGNRGMLDKNWRELLDWAQLEYYIIHGTMLSPLREWPQPREGKDTVFRASATDKIASVKPKKLPYCPVRHEPLGYLRVAEDSSLPAFKYLSHYHALEYFFDDVVYADLHSEIQRILSSPRFESNREKYARALTDLVERFRFPLGDDKDKLKLTLRKFIPFSILQDDTPKPVLETLKKKVQFDGGLKLDSVNLEDEDKFFGDLAARVYTMRNAIVHSKHAESDARGSYDSGRKDTELLKQESAMLKHFVLEVMFRSGSVS